jgi:Domain of unknown function (DUF5666)
MRFSSIPLFLLLASAGTSATAPPAYAAQAASQTPAAPTRVVGSVTAISGQSITVKPDKGEPVTLTIADTARILETQPGAKTLAGATPIQLSGVAVGDRILAAVHPSADGSGLTATTLIAMKQSAIAERRKAEEADWQRRGVGGLVKTVDDATGTLTIASGPRTITIHATPQTVIRRYSTDSIKFSDTQPSTLTAIHPGDQLRARGNHTADGSEVTAEEIVAGTFRNIAGTVLSIDPAANTVTVKDLATKKPVIIHITPESQMHKLPAQIAQYLATSLKRPSGQGAQQAGNEAGHEPSQAEHAEAAPQAGAQQGNDLSRMLERTPPVQLSELHKGDAVMIVATEGTPGSATAVTLVAGVEPILTASPSASQSMFSASWNVGGGGEEGAGQEGTQ